MHVQLQQVMNVTIGVALSPAEASLIAEKVRRILVLWRQLPGAHLTSVL
jgi:hypothetical protein